MRQMIQTGLKLNKLLKTSDPLRDDCCFVYLEQFGSVTGSDPAHSEVVWNPQTTLLLNKDLYTHTRVVSQL